MGDTRLDSCLRRLDQVLGRMMRQTHIQLGKHVPDGLTMNQFLVCKRVFVHRRMTVSALAEDLGVTLSAVTAAADKLVEMGLLERQRDEADRRLVWLALTPEGEAMQQQALDQWRVAMQDYFAVLPIEELEQLVRISERLLEAHKVSPHQ